jgi:hypothetical protein
MLAQTQLVIRVRARLDMFLWVRAPAEFGRKLECACSKAYTQAPAEVWGERIEVAEGERAVCLHFAFCLQHVLFLRCARPACSPCYRMQQQI